MNKFKHLSSKVKRSSTKKNNEAGYGVIMVILLLFFFFVMVFAGVASSVSSSRSQENLVTRQKEKWQAKSGLAVMRRVLQVRMPEMHRAHLAEAQNCLPTGSPMFKAFDEQDLPLSESVPVAIAQADGTVVCSESGGEYTSLLGNSNGWANTLLPLWEEEARTFGFSAQTINVARLSEQARQFSVGDPVYNFGFIIDARGGQHYRVRDTGEVLLGNLSANCGATGILEINPLTVATGNPVTFRITYTNVNRLRILNLAGVVLQDVTVVEQAAPQVYEWIYLPAATDSYRVEALSSNPDCYSRSAFIQVTVTVVPPPPCPTINSFVANPPAVPAGQISTLAWNVFGAAEVTLDGVVVAPIASQDFTIIANRTFTLVARDAANACPQTETVTVTLLPPPIGCDTPVINLFNVAPPIVGPGDTVTINWQVNNVLAGGVVNITLPDGTVLSDVGASGSRTITAPGSEGIYNYSISAQNPCGTSAGATAQLQVVNGCVPPTINSYNANPLAVLVGGSQTVTFNWSVSGTVDSQSIDQGIGVVSGNSVSIIQPQTTTTYTITVVGCGQTRQSQVTVMVNPIGGTCPVGQHRVAANRSIAIPSVVFPYSNQSFIIDARADYYEATRSLRFNFEIRCPAPIGVFNPMGSACLSSNFVNGPMALVEVSNLRFTPAGFPPRVLVYFNNGTYPGQLIFTIPLNYSGTSNGEDTYSVNGSALTVPGIDVPYIFDPSFDPQLASNSLLISSHAFPVYAFNQNGGGDYFNTFNQSRSSLFGACVND